MSTSTKSFLANPFLIARTGVNGA